MACRLSRLAAVALFAACGGGSDPAPQALLEASPGLPLYQEVAAVPVPGGVVNAAGGNLLVRRVDLAIDTRLGTWEIGAIYNSKTHRWLWSFETSYDGMAFVDPSGAVHANLYWVADGALIPGTVWIKRDAARIQSAGGLVHEFAADGRLAAVRWASDAYPRLEHLAQEIAGRARTTEIRQCRAPGACSLVAQIAYDGAGRVVSILDRAGRLADFAYDASGWLATARDALDVERSLPGFRYEYRGDQRLVAVTSSEGERVEYRWHPNQGRITEARALGDEGAVYRFEYAIGSDPEAFFETRCVDPLGAATLWRFDGERRLRRHELPTGEVTTREWSGFELSRLVRPGGATTSWQHVGADRVLRTDPNGNVVHVAYRTGAAESRAEPFRRPVAQVDDGLGLIERRGYDTRGRLAWVENGAGERTRFGWNAENLLASETRPDGIRVDWAEHGEHGHAQRVSSRGEVETRVFDAVGNPISSAGLEAFDLRPGGELLRRFDADRNLAELVLADLPAVGAPSEASIRISWRSDHRPLRIERPGGGDHEFDYDAQGRLVARRERSDGAWVATRFEVDALGRAAATTLANGMRREARWDAAGRPSGLTARRDGALEGELEMTWQDGRPTRAIDSTTGGSETSIWSAAGELVAIEYPGGERLEIAHDLRGRTLHETYRLADGSVLREIGFEWDAADRRVALREDGALLVAHVFEAGRLARTTLGNGLVRSHAYAAATGLPSAATSVAPGGAVVEATLQSFLRDDPAGELRVVVETASAGAATTREELALGPLGGAGKRLLAAGDGVQERRFTADALSNTTAAGDDALLYDAQGLRLLARVDAASGAWRAGYVWDAAGFCVARGGIELRWTALGRIAAIGDDASFAWDLRGRPLARTLAGEPVRFRFGGRVETDAAGVPRRLDLGEVAIRLDTGEHRYRHRDLRGNVRLESDDLGAAAVHLSYGPYGIEARLGASDGAATFAGGRDLGELVLLGGRLLDARAGRFLAPDPVLQLVNQYAYTLANPVFFWDPDGSEWQLVGFLYGAFGTAGAAAIGSATAAASGSAIVGTLIGGPIGTVLGIAVAQALVQIANPGERGAFTASDALEMAAPLYASPPPPSEPRGDAARSSRTGTAAPAPSGGASECDCAGGPGGSASMRFGAWAAGGVGGAVGGGYGAGF